MPYFAKCEPTLESTKFIVSDVIHAQPDFIATQVGYWVQGDYNTYGNVHFAPSPPAEAHTPDGGTPIRANYPGKGYIYDLAYTVGDYVGVFYAPKPVEHPDWVLNTTTFLWEPPTP